MGELLIEFLGFIAYGTGEFLLYLLTGGRRKPQVFIQEQNQIDKKLRYYLSLYSGIILWGAVFLLIVWLASL
jgi:hypothetical protein